MNPKLYWIDSPWKGKLAISARPRGGDWLEDDVKGWRKAGIGAVFSLLTPEELPDLGLSDEKELSERESLRFFSLPIPDRRVPASNAAASVVLRNVQQILWRRERMWRSIAARAFGRSGMIAAALLTAQGVSPSDALHRVSAARGWDVPETDEQRAWVMQMAGAGV